MRIRFVKNRPYEVDEKGRYVHRVVMGALPGQIVDHINDDTLDNRPENLRFVTVGQNRQRSRCKPQGLSGFVGVSVNRSRRTVKWEAKIWHCGKCHYLGSFKKAEDAAMAYDRVAIELFGPLCKTNLTT